MEHKMKHRFSILFFIFLLFILPIGQCHENTMQKTNIHLARAGNMLDLLCNADYCVIKLENSKHQTSERETFLIEKDSDYDWINDNVIEITSHFGVNAKSSYFLNFNDFSSTSLLDEVVAADPVRNIVAYCSDEEPKTIVIKPLFDDNQKPILVTRDFADFSDPYTSNMLAYSSAINYKKSHFTKSGDLLLEYVSNTGNKKELIKINFNNKS